MTTLSRAFDLQRRARELPRWARDSVRRGGPTAVRYDLDHSAGSLEATALDWITRHRPAMPTAFRPTLEELQPFARMCYSTLFTAREYPDVPAAGCRCEWCRALRCKAASDLGISPDARAAARALEEGWLIDLAAEAGLALDATQARRLAREPEWMAEVAVCAHGEELVRRLEVWSRDAVLRELERRFTSGAGRRPVLPFWPGPERVLAARSSLKQAIRALPRGA